MSNENQSDPPAPTPHELPVFREPLEWLRRSPPWLQVVLVVTIYLTLWYGLDLMAVRFESAPEIQVWYPPSALDVVLLLVFGLRFWPTLLLNTFIHYWFVSPRQLPIETLIVFDVVTTIGYTGACWLLLKVLKINPRLRQLRDVIWFTVIAALIAPLIIAFLQVVNFATIGLIPWSQWLMLTLHYCAGDSTGIGMLAPFLLVLLRKVPWIWLHREARPLAGNSKRSPQDSGGDDELRWPSRQGIPVLLFHVTLLAAGIWVGYGTPRGTSLDYTYFVFLPMIWIAIQYGFPRATATVLGINLGVAFLVGSRSGAANTLALQFGLMGFTHTGIVLGAIATERKRAAQRLKQMYQRVRTLNRGLERQVHERTAQLNQQMQQLQQLGHLKDDFLSTVSHELRSPMANMKMAIRMLQLSSNHEHRDRYLEILQHECDRETALINDLLDLQRIEAGADIAEMQSLCLQTWLPAIVDTFQERAQSGQQVLRLHLDSHLPAVLTDPAKLERIVTELLTNACKYTPPGGEITICVTLPPPEVEAVTLRVCNTSVEIPPAELSRIFEKFYRIPMGDRWKQGGTGLGLALVEKLVGQLGAQIRVESRSLQIVFTIDLPSTPP
ncbi:ATP-binding protein [Phormidesmis sp. 146-35]